MAGFNKMLFGVGINDASYVTKHFKTIEGKKKLVWYCLIHSTWYSMLSRCYSEQAKTKYKSYENCSVCNEWLTFSNFKAWMDTQDWQGKQLDKDLLHRGNKIYSPESCLFVEPIVNYFIIEQSNRRGNYPIGVSWHKGIGKFVSSCSNPFSGKKEHLGTFSCQKLAHSAWLKRKRELAIQLAGTQSDKRVAESLMVRYSNESYKNT